MRVLFRWGTAVVYESTVNILTEGTVSRPDLLPEASTDLHDSHHSKDVRPAKSDDLSRKVYCVLGMPLDAFDMGCALKAAKNAALRSEPCLLSTPNLNFLVNCLTNKTFRRSLLLSDMSIADGMPLVWIARLLGLPIHSRVAGSELFEKMVQKSVAERPIKVFLFGGADGVAEKASAAMNASSESVQCVGTLNPGFGTIEDMSSASIIERINASGADFLVVALGAQKGQEWLLRNHYRLKSPLRAHLGACMNFQAGTVARAPQLFQKYGLEWLWRIKEEPQLWRRYRHDGLALIRLMFARIIPLALKHHVINRLTSDKPQPLEITVQKDFSSRILIVQGHAVENNIEGAIHHFRSALNENSGSLTVDMSGAKAVDQRFLGLLMMACKQAAQNGVPFRIKAGSRAVKHAFKLNEADYLLTDNIQDQMAMNRGPVSTISRNVATGDT